MLIEGPNQARLSAGAAVSQSRMEYETDVNLSIPLAHTMQLSTHHHQQQQNADREYLMTKTAAMHLQNREMVGHHQINHAGTGLNASGSAGGDARVNGTDGNALTSDEVRSGGGTGSNSDGKPHQCHQCLKAFTSNHQLVQHLRVHTGEKPYKCSYCERRFKQLSHVQQHTRLHTGERPYKCHVPDCGRAFIQLSNLQQHLRNHESQLERLKNRPFHCNVCGKGFATESSLRTHNGKHTTLVGGPNPACCPMCQKICLSGEALMEHMKFVHKDPNASGVPVKRRNANHPCPVCGKFYVNEGSLRKHLTCHPEMAGQLTSSLRMWPCSVCTAVFTHENGLVNHMDQMRMDPKHQFAAQFVLSRAANERRERDALLAAAAVNMSHFAMTAGLASGLGGSPTTGHHHADSPARISTPANVKEQAIATASRSSLGLHHPQGVSQGQQMLDFYGRMNGDISSVMANGGLRSDVASLNNSVSGMTNQHHLASPHNHHQVAAETVSKIATDDFYGSSNNNNNSTNKCVQ